MMKTSTLPLFCSLGLCASAFAGENSRHVPTWAVPDDLLQTSNQISFNQGARGVWYFMQSPSFEHDPSTYSFIPEYEAICEITPAAPPDPRTGPGLLCWKHPPQPVDPLPQADLNVTNMTQVRHELAFPPHAFALHPSPVGFGILAWKSPIRGKVNVNGFFSDLNSTCGNGVVWTIDQGKTTLRSGEVNASSQSFSLSQVSVRRGQVLYFIVDPKDGDYFCDTTQLKVTITAAGWGSDRDEDLGTDESDGQ